MDRNKIHDETTTDKFCSNCGHPLAFQRIDKSYIIEELSNIINLKKGFFYTVKEVYIRPGKTAKKFTNGERKRFVKPVVFLIICSLLYTISKYFFNYELGYINYNDKFTDPSVTVKMFKWFAENYGYSNILMAIFIAFWVKIFFRKSVYNYFEILILVFYITGVSTLIYTLSGIFDTTIGINVSQFSLYLSLLYTSWSIANFFETKKKLHFVKAVLSHLFGLATSILMLLAIGNGLELLIKVISI
ncbi:DUF3667 domain-containing protein [Aquimarina agarivorans]|uniref:DUF3667 domain-containing protein n=1 Tax=Aquimarina agarivorans TaxID=980584 RepID=UPI000248E900|nr:DUF3667 domain-containing protein [Aquimarina agarivorans]